MAEDVGDLVEASIASYVGKVPGFAGIEVRRREEDDDRPADYLLVQVDRLEEMEERFGVWVCSCSVTLSLRTSKHGADDLREKADALWVALRERGLATALSGDGISVGMVSRHSLARSVTARDWIREIGFTAHAALA